MGNSLNSFILSSSRILKLCFESFIHFFFSLSSFDNSIKTRERFLKDFSSIRDSANEKGHLYQQVKQENQRHFCD